MGMKVELNCDVFSTDNKPVEFIVIINKDSRDQESDQSIIVKLNNDKFCPTSLSLLQYARRHSYYPCSVGRFQFDKEAVDRMVAEIVTAHQMINAGSIPVGF